MRRDVAVGSSYIPSDGNPKHHGQFVTHYGRVDLCKACNEARDRFNEIVGVILIGGVGTLALAGLCSAVLGMAGAIVVASLGLLGLVWFFHVWYGGR